MPSPLYGRYAAVGFELTGSVLGGFFVGRAVDARFATHGVALWICFFLGISCGFWLLVRAARQLEKDAEQDEKKEREEADAAKLVRRLEQVEREEDEEQQTATQRRTENERKTETEKKTATATEEKRTDRRDDGT